MDDATRPARPVSGPTPTAADFVAEEYVLTALMVGMDSFHLVLTHRPTWMADAACKGIPTKTFVNEALKNQGRSQRIYGGYAAKGARETCSRCCPRALLQLRHGRSHA